jgi:hypothetical protein
VTVLMTVSGSGGVSFGDDTEVGGAGGGYNRSNAIPPTPGQDFLGKQTS